MKISEIVTNIEQLILSNTDLALDAELNVIDLNIQMATSSHIIFYNINSDARSEEVFKKRLVDIKYGLLILNRFPKFLEGNKNIIVVGDAQFLECQKILCDELYPLNMSLFKLVGVTGTNGKSTTVCLASQISSMQALTKFFCLAHHVL